MKVKALLFDVYGTLISTGNGSVNAAKKILESNGVSICPKEFYKSWKEIHRKNMNRDIFETERKIFCEDLVELYDFYDIKGNALEDVKVMLNSLYKRIAFDETKDSLRKLSYQYKLVIASNTDTEPLEENLFFNGLSFQNVYTSERLRGYKPNARFYKEILADMKLKCEEVIFIGDSETDDVLGPLSIGIKSIRICRKGILPSDSKAALVLYRLPLIEDIEGL